MKQYFKPHEILTKKEPADLGMLYTSVQRVEVGAEPVALESGAEELCFICIGGRVDYQTEGQSGTAVQMDMLYLPIESGITFTSSEGGVMMRYGAPCTRRTKFVTFALRMWTRTAATRCMERWKTGHPPRCVELH